MIEKVMTASMIGAGAWLFWNVSELKDTVGRLEVTATYMESRDQSFEARLSRLERR